MRLLHYIILQVLIPLSYEWLVSHDDDSKHRKWTNYRRQYQRIQRSAPPMADLMSQREPGPYEKFVRQDNQKYSRNYVLPSIRHLRMSKPVSSRRSELYQMQNDYGNSRVYSFSRQPSQMCRSCGVVVLQDSFCNDDFTIKGYIYNVTRRDLLQIEYKVHIEEVYRDSLGQFRKFFSSHLTYTCNRRNEGLDIFKSYILSGNYMNQRAVIDSCSYIKLSTHTTWHQTKYLEKFYAQSCGLCTIKRTFDMQPGLPAKNACHISVGSQSNDFGCRTKFSVCLYDSTQDRCAFTTNRAYKHCKRYS